MSTIRNIINLPPFNSTCVKAFRAPPVRPLAFSSVQHQGHSVNQNNVFFPVSRLSCKLPSSSSLRSPLVFGGIRRLQSTFIEHRHKPRNKFSRLRSQITAMHRLGAVPPPAADSSQSNYPPAKVIENENEIISCRGFGMEVARKAISVLAQNNKTWTRLAPIIELAASYSADGGSDGFEMTQSKGKDKKNTIADIGCDHGLLSIALAASGRYRNVVGIDLSSRALEDGALQFYKKMKNILTGTGIEHDDYRRSLDDLNQNQDQEQLLDLVLPLEFRVGNGLKPLSPGEADIVCIAGVGINTMLSILLSNREYDDVKLQDKDDSIIYNIDRIQCNKLLLQPTNSRPRNMKKLYRKLQRFGFTLVDERIVFLASRWYITCAFERFNSTSDNKSELHLPGTILAARGDEEFSKYMKHHTKWLNNDIRQNSSLDEDDILWLKQIESIP